MVKLCNITDVNYDRNVLMKNIYKKLKYFTEN